MTAKRSENGVREFSRENAIGGSNKVFKVVRVCVNDEQKRDQTPNDEWMIYIYDNSFFAASFTKFASMQ